MPGAPDLWQAPEQKVASSGHHSPLRWRRARHGL